MQEKGFTLIELLVTTVILGILIVIGTAGYLNAQDRAKETQVKVNAHAIQIVAETYAVNWKGLYPAKKDGTEVTQIDTFRKITSPYNDQIVCTENADCGIDNAPNTALIIYNTDNNLPNSILYSGAVVYSGRNEKGDHTETSGAAVSYIIKGLKKSKEDGSNEYISDFSLTHSVKK
jgi:prepilin-type N-terminal cleavage/methylation domain-containing protein